MNELIEAAKAVIYRWDSHKREDYLALGEYMSRLRAAVERAEKQDAKPWTKPIPTDFKEWWETYALNKYGMGPAYHAWSAGKQAERERIKEIIKAISIQGNHDAWFDACDRIVEKIDGL